MGKLAKGLLAGPKFSGRHTSIIPPATALISAIRNTPEISKIVISIITPGGGQLRIKFQPVTVGWQLKVIGGRASQIFFIHTKSPELVRRKIEHAWASLRGEK